MTFFNRNIWFLLLFSIAMGYLETAVVVYLRELYYPSGFTFPMTGMPARIIMVELLREAATIIMLIMVGVITGKTPVQRFGYFIFCFAVWDIFYYIFLKLLLNWPSSLFDWDILFLIPMPWVGPVLAPAIISLTMILWTAAIEKTLTPVSPKVRWIFSAGAFIIICSFMWDYIIAAFSEQKFLSFCINYRPVFYNWWIFSIGEALLLYAIYYYYMSGRGLKQHSKIS